MKFNRCAIFSNPSNGASGRKVTLTTTAQDLVSAVSDGQETTAARFVEVWAHGTCYLRVGADAAASEGIPISAGGCWFSPTPITARVSGITASGTCVVEVVTYNQV